MHRLYIKWSATVFFVAVFTISGFSQDDDFHSVLEHSHTELEFFYDDKSQTLKAEMFVHQTFRSITDFPHNIERVLTFDSQSEIGDIKYKSGRRWLKIKPVISDYESDGFFHTDLKLMYFDHAMSAKGELFELTYTKTFNNVMFLSSMYFVDQLPMELCEVEIVKPKWLDLNIKEWNFDITKPTSTKSTEEGFDIATYKLKDIDASGRSHAMPSRSKLYPHLILIPQAYSIEGKKKQLMNGTEDLYSWYAKLVNDMNNQPRELKSLVQELTAGSTNDLEKIKSIYYWVQDNIRYIAFEYGIMGFQPDDCQSVFKKKYGDCKGMANLTKEMLQLAGIDARLTWLGTQDIPYTYGDMPSLMVDNHMICTAIVDGKKLFLDPTEKHIDINVNAYRISGREVLIENGDSYMLENIPAFNIMDNKIGVVNNLKLENDLVSGAGAVTYGTAQKSFIMYRLSTITRNEHKESLEQMLAKGDSNYQYDISELPEKNLRDQNLELKYDVSIKNKVIDLGAEKYVNLEADFYMTNGAIEEERDVAYEFSEPVLLESATKFEVPQGWKISYLPDPVKIDHPKYSFEVTFSESNGTVNYNKAIRIKEVLLELNDFPEWNAAIEKLNVAYSDQIILSK